MSKPVIKRFFSKDIFGSIKVDCKFLIDKVIKSGHELDFQIRNNYFNLYFRGNSIGEVKYQKRYKLYKIKIHEKFVIDGLKKSSKEDPTIVKNYYFYLVEPKKLKSFFKKENISAISSKIKNVNYGEEIAFEQILITDNIDKKDLVIIDRQISDSTDRKKIDLLTLLQKNGNKYQFCVIEVKLGKNKELEGEVAGQLLHYMEKIKCNFNDYKNCYIENIRQKKYWGLFEQLGDDAIEIIPEVKGLIVVGGYSVLAKNKIKKLMDKYPNINVQQIKNEIKIK